MSTPTQRLSPEAADDRAEIVFFEALKQSPESRSGFLDQECGTDPGLRAEVETLLRDHERAGSFLQVDAPLSDELAAEFARLKPEEVDDRIGPYKLLELIGEGGFGRVWVAEQERPIRRRVALKITKLGMDTREVIARFEQERQALALMEHPNIARVLDAGATPLGRPFFAMELVRGVKITEYCDQAELPTQERLRLFMQVCSAVQHAHQKGIIHRDLKPSNILVSLHDGVPVPKVIDFGVAKATQRQRLTDLTVYTQFEQMIGTPLYMSPEQAEFSGLDVDTRSDIYSLGVLLYELLTGRTPFDPEYLMKTGLDEMRRVIREVEPPRPSTFLRTMAVDTRTDVARHRQSESAKLISTIKGDLDWIVMKALEKDRNRRYESAGAVARDVERHLQNEPVHARPPSTAYRFRRFVRRNRITFAACISVAAALMTGTSVSVWQAMRANHALEELHASAPTFFNQGHGFIAQDRFEEALATFDMAIKLRPSVADYQMAKADLLQSQLRFTEAARIYRNVLKLTESSARAERNAALSARFGDEIVKQGTLSRESLLELFGTMRQEQRSATEMMKVASTLGMENDLLLTHWSERLKRLPFPAESPLKDRLKVNEKGELRLDLSGTSISELTMLKGMPLAWLDLSGCSEVSDLTPLRGMPLKTLMLGPLSRDHLGLPRYACAVSDLSPLTGMELVNLNLKQTNVVDLSPIQGMPLADLNLAGTSVASLSPLQGMPLKALNCTSLPVRDFSHLAGLPLVDLSLGDTAVEDLSVLAGMPLKTLLIDRCIKAGGYKALMQIPDLEVLLLRTDYWELPEEELAALGSLQKHPSLRQIEAYSGRVRSLSAVTAKEEFWKDFNSTMRFHTALMKVAGGDRTRFSRRGETWTLRMEGTELRDLSGLTGVPISTLMISDTEVSDLSPLRGMPLRVLFAAGTKVTSLEPLEETPLERLFLDRCPPGIDLAPLGRIKSLYSVLLPPNPRNIDALRGLSSLKYLSFEADRGFNNRFAQTAVQFWNGQQPTSAELLAREERFPEAESALRTTVSRSDSIHHWQSLGVAIFAQGDHARYEAFGREVLERFRGTSKEVAATKVCLLGPRPAAPLEALNAIVRSWCTMDSSPWYLLTDSLLALRSGQPERAIAVAQRIPLKPHPAAAATGDALSAIAYWQLGKHELARRDLARASEAIEPCWPAPALRDTVWHDWAIASLLLSEARELILHQSAGLPDLTR